MSKVVKLAYVSPIDAGIAECLEFDAQGIVDEERDDDVEEKS